MTLTEAVVALREPRFAWYFAARTTTTIGSAMTTVALAELHELFDFVSLEEAEAHYQKSLF